MKTAALILAFLLAASAGLAQTAKKKSKTTPAQPADTIDPMVPLEGRPWPLETVAIHGNRLYTPQQILAAAGLRIGDKYGKTEFDAARDRLVATGAFDNVSYQFAPAKDFKGYNAEFTVAEMAQVYQLRFEDLPATDAQLRACLKAKDPLFGDKIPATRPELNRYIAWISEYLATLNYHEPVSGQLSSDAGPELMVVFRPAAARPNIARVKFTNTGDVPATALQTAMFGVAVGVPYTEKQLRLLLDTTARPLYEAKGMIRAAFPKVDVEPSKDVSGVEVSVDVVPGPVYQLDRVRFTGDDSSPQPLSRIANLKTKQTVNFDDVRAAQDRIAQSLHRRGFLDCSSQVRRDINDQEHTVSLAFEIDPGPQYLVGKVDMVGLDIETEPPVRKMWGLRTGEPFNVEYPDHFLQRVKDGGVFENLKTTRAETKIDKASHTVDITLYFNK